MDPSSSNSEYQDHHRIGVQQRDWLSCSTSAAGNSTQMEVRDVTIDDGEEKDRRRLIVEREHMFDKVVTPSDVGKLNRLVIPKQHAEKYFPLDSTTTTTTTTTSATNNSSGNNDSNNNNKAGLLLNFEDRTGKSWRFRYSYWNSSQSYVMTKGWSRFVKEKQLSAGDIVSFQRAVGDDIHSKNTFFIDWRRRPPDHHHHHHHHLGTAFSVHHSIPTWGGGGGGGGLGTNSTTPTFFLRSHPHESHPHPHHNHNALWDHSNFCNNNNNNSNNVTHLSPMNGNIMSMVPYAYGTGSGSGSSSGPVNPSAGSLILLRSPVPNSASLIPHLMPVSSSSSHHLINYPSLLTTSNNEAFQRGRIENGMPPPKVYDSIPVVHGKAPVPSSVGGGGPAKRSLRLFGVNMEYDNNNNHEFDGSPSTSSSNYDA